MSHEGAAMPGDAASTDLLRALEMSLAATGAGWHELCLVLELAGGRCNGTYGYTYQDDRTPTPVSVRPRLVAAQVRAYLDGCLQPGDALPVKMLVQYDRTTGRFEITLEATNSSRWQVTPANVDVVREELRPRLG